MALSSLLATSLVLNLRKAPLNKPAHHEGHEDMGNCAFFRAPGENGDRLARSIMAVLNRVCVFKTS